MVETCFLGLLNNAWLRDVPKPTRYCTPLAIFSVVLGYEPGQRSDQTMRPVEAWDSVQAARDADGKDQVWRDAFGAGVWLGNNED
jgi:hypothetical protein